MPLIIPYTSEAQWLAMRAMDVTSTETAALFGMSPYCTEFELYHRKKDQTLVSFQSNERMKWGNRLEPVIAAGVAEDRNWLIEPLKVYMRADGLRMGSSFDFKVIDPVRGAGIMEIKNVDSLVFRDNWIDDGDESEAPEHIEVQLQHQLEVADMSWGCIVALVGGNTPKVIMRDRDRAIGKAIRSKIAEFWKRVDDSNPPAPSFPSDAEFVGKLYGYAEPGKIFDARGDVNIVTLCQQYSDAAKREKLAEEDKQTAKAKLLMLMGDREKALVDGFNISAGLVGPATVAYERDGYRSFRLTAKKPVAVAA